MKNSIEIPRNIFMILGLILIAASLSAQVQMKTKDLNNPKMTVIKAKPITEQELKTLPVRKVNPVLTEKANPNTTIGNRNPGNVVLRPIPGRTVNPGNSDNSGNQNPGYPEPDKEREGPSNITFSISSQIESDIDWPGHGVINVFNTIYRDANKNSGYYYYLPSSYSLSWNENTQEYDFYATYNAATASGRGETTVTAILQPKLTINELKIIEDLLKNSIKGKPEQQFGVTDLISVPMAQAPDIAFSNLTQFGVQPGDISIRAPADLMDAIYISFTTDRIDDLMGMFFNNIGLYGDVIVYPAGEGMPSSIKIPFNLKIDDPGTFGRMELAQATWRQGWQNKTDYPIIVTDFNIMKRRPNGSYKIYTWKTGDVQVPEKSRVNFDHSAVPAWIDTDNTIVKMWMDYTIKPCHSCSGIIKDKIVKGTAGSRVNNIELTVLTPLEFTEAEMMKVRIRSVQADPNGYSKIDLPTITVTKDGSTYSGGQLFVPDGGKPDYEYMVQIYMSDGTKYESDGWKRSSDLDLVIGSSQIKSMISHFK